MTWIDYRKDYDMVPHSWIERRLDIFGIAENIKKSESMKSWRTELTSGSNVSWDGQIQKGIFKGDAPSPLPFVIAMIPLNLPLRRSRFAYDFNTPFAVHYEKIGIHLLKTATNSAKIHSLERKSEHLRINQIQ